MTTKLFVLCFSGYLCHIKKSTVLQTRGLNERTGGKSGIHIFKHRKGQTYEQIKLAKNRLFIFTCFNPVSPNSDQHQFSSDSQYP